MADGTISERQLQEWQAACKAATPGPYFWNTYSGIFSSGVPRDNEMNDAFEDEPPYAQICSISQAPRHQDCKGDQLRSLQAEANARYVEAALNAFPELLQIVSELRQSKDGL